MARRSRKHYSTGRRQSSTGRKENTPSKDTACDEIKTGEGTANSEVKNASQVESSFADSGTSMEASYNPDFVMLDCTETTEADTSIIGNVEVGSMPASERDLNRVDMEDELPSLSFEANEDVRRNDFAETNKNLHAEKSPVRPDGEERKIPEDSFILSESFVSIESLSVSSIDPTVEEISSCSAFSQVEEVSPNQNPDVKVEKQEVLSQDIGSPSIEDDVTRHNQVCFNPDEQQVNTEASGGPVTPDEEERKVLVDSFSLSESFVAIQPLSVSLEDPNVGEITSCIASVSVEDDIARPNQVCSNADEHQVNTKASGEDPMTPDGEERKTLIDSFILSESFVAVESLSVSPEDPTVEEITSCPPSSQVEEVSPNQSEFQNSDAGVEKQNVLLPNITSLNEDDVTEKNQNQVCNSDEQQVNAKAGDEECIKKDIIENNTTESGENLLHTHDQAVEPKEKQVSETSVCEEPAEEFPETSICEEPAEEFPETSICEEPAEEFSKTSKCYSADTAPRDNQASNESTGQSSEESARNKDFLRQSEISDPNTSKENQPRRQINPGMTANQAVSEYVLMEQSSAESTEHEAVSVQISQGGLAEETQVGLKSSQDEQDSEQASNSSQDESQNSESAAIAPRKISSTEAEEVTFIRPQLFMSYYNLWALNKPWTLNALEGIKIIVTKIEVFINACKRECVKWSLRNKLIEQDASWFERVTGTLGYIACNSSLVAISLIHALVITVARVNLLVLMKQDYALKRQMLKKSPSLMAEVNSVKDCIKEVCRTTICMVVTEMLDKTNVSKQLRSKNANGSSVVDTFIHKLCNFVETLWSGEKETVETFRDFLVDNQPVLEAYMAALKTLHGSKDLFKSGIWNVITNRGCNMGCKLTDALLVFQDFEYHFLLHKQVDGELQSNVVPQIERAIDAIRKEDEDIKRMFKEMGII